MAYISYFFEGLTPLVEVAFFTGFFAGAFAAADLVATLRFGAAFGFTARGFFEGALVTLVDAFLAEDLALGALVFTADFLEVGSFEAALSDLEAEISA